MLDQIRVASKSIDLLSFRFVYIEVPYIDGNLDKDCFFNNGRGMDVHQKYVQFVIERYRKGYCFI